MNLYLLTQTINNHWDTFDSCIVSANTAEEAVLIRPDTAQWDFLGCFDDSWVDNVEDVLVEYIGVAYTKESKVIHRSFRAG